MQSHRRNHSRWAHVNTPAGLRRRNAIADAKRETLAASLPPAAEAPQPLAHWQRIMIDLYVPISGRCDQHAAVIDGERVGLLSATQIGAKLRGVVRSRPSVEVLADARRDVCMSARDELDAAAS